ncbi:hypothetical protein [Paracoccus aminovorans]|uniref:hypothetical protein n=1 Tax=Paracoccus aminovorans TaxID=34004 RepID=UPI001113C80C|nr:hypothetical protein [Paracoccus aminovorans]
MNGLEQGSRFSTDPEAEHGIPIDFDHRSMAPQAIADSRAAGWIRDLKLEGGGHGVGQVDADCRPRWKIAAAASFRPFSTT